MIGLERYAIAPGHLGGNSPRTPKDCADARPKILTLGQRTWISDLDSWLDLMRCQSLRFAWHPALFATDTLLTASRGLDKEDLEEVNSSRVV